MKVKSESEVAQSCTTLCDPMDCSLPGSFIILIFNLNSGFFAMLAYFLEKAMATHSSTLAWKIPWTEEPGRLQSMGSLGVGHNWGTSLSLFPFMHWRRTDWKYEEYESPLSASFNQRLRGFCEMVGWSWLILTCKVWLLNFLKFCQSVVKHSCY